MHTLAVAATNPRELEEFQEATRSLTSILAPVEKRTLLWLAHRMPGWVNSDHLTALALVAMLLAGLSYWLASVTPVPACCSSWRAWRSTGSATAWTARWRACATISARATASTSITSSTRSARCSCSAVWGCRAT